MASVVVVGAGLAGLSCAWRLKRAGYDVEVLEHASEAGGRLQTERVDGFLLEPGAATFTSHDRSLHSIANHLELGTQVQSVLRYPDAVVYGGGYSVLRPVEDPLLLRAKAVGRLSSLRLLRLRAEWMRWRKDLDPTHLRAPEAIARLEAEDLVRYLDRIVGSELRERVIAPYVSMNLGLDSENLSAAYLLLLIDRVLDARPQYLVGGMSQLTTRLSDRLSIRFGCEVTSLESQSDGARVQYKAGSRTGLVYADAVVMAVPGTLVTQLCPKLTPSERGFFDSVRYSRSVDVHLMFEEELDLPYRAVAFPRNRSQGLYGVQVSHHKRGAAPTGKALLKTSFTEAAAEQMWQASDADVGKRVLADLRLTPLGDLAPKRIVVHRSAASAPVFYPGAMGNLSRFGDRTDRSSRIAFCGDYLVGNGSEAALTSGMRAASQLAHALG